MGAFRAQSLHPYAAQLRRNPRYRLETFEYSGQSFHFNLLSDFHLNDKTNVQTLVGAGPIVLAAVPDDNLYYGEGRDYNFGMGFGIRAGAILMFSDRFFFNIHYRGGWFNAVNGNESSYYLYAPGAEMTYIIFDGLSFGLEAGFFNVDAHYDNYPATDKQYPFGRLSIGYHLGN